MLVRKRYRADERNRPRSLAAPNQHQSQYDAGLALPQVFEASHWSTRTLRRSILPGSEQVSGCRLELCPVTHHLGFC